MASRIITKIANKRVRNGRQFLYHAHLGEIVSMIGTYLMDLFKVKT